MSKEAPSQLLTALIMRENDANFFLVSNRPFAPREGSYRRLERMAPALVQQLEGGNQVFVYPRSEFDPRNVMGGSGHKFTAADIFRGQVILAAHQMDRPVIIEPAVHRVEDRRVPNPDAMFLV